MHTNIVSFIFLLVFLKNVASQRKLLVVDLINKGSDDTKIKLNEAYELIKDKHHQKLHKAFFGNLDKFDKTNTGVNNAEFDYDEPEFNYDEQETFKLENCRSLRPKDIRECLKYNIEKLKDQSHKTEMEREPDIFKKIKTPDECMALDATMFAQLQCLSKFKNHPKFYEINDEINYDKLENVKDPDDCLFLKKTTIHRKLKCLEIVEKKKVPEVIIKYDNFENIKDPNECLFLEKATVKNKLKCLEKFEKKHMVINDEIEHVKHPSDCLSLKTTIKNKYKCLDKFGNANDEDYEVAILDDDFDDLKEPNDCLFLKETIEIKLKCLDKFQKVEDKAKKMTIPMADENKLRTEAAKVIKTPEDCLFDHTSYGKKLKCLDDIEKHKENLRSRSTESNHQFIATRPKRKIYSLYNYYNAIMKPSAFKDLTRQQFSQDYLDISELSRSIPKCRTPECNVDLLKLSYNIKEKNPDLINNSRRIFDSVHTRYIQADSDDDSDEIESPKPTKKKVQKKKNGVPIRFTVVSKEERPNDSESDEHRDLKAEVKGDSFEYKQDSEEEHQALKKKKQSLKWIQKSPSEEIDQKSFLLFESEEDKGMSAETESPKKSFEKKKKKKAKKSHNDDYSIETERPSSFKYSYLQGNNVVDFFRRRLEHFLPKRYHWEQEDFRNLGYHWYDGPRGKWTQ